MAAHRLVHIHGCQRRDIKTCQPHIHHNGYFHRVIIVFEAFGQFLFILLVADNLVPFFRILVASGHYHFYLFIPFRTKFQYFVVDAHGNRSGVSHNHGFSCQFVLAVFFIVLQNIPAKRINGSRRTQDFFQVRHLLLAFLYLFFCSPFFGKQFVFIVYGFEGSFVQIQIDYTRFIIYRAGSTVRYGLCHIVHVNIASEHLHRISVFGRDWCTCKTDIRSIRQRIVDDSCRADDSFGNIFALLILGHFDFLFKTILTSVRFIGHHDNVLS